MRTLVAQHSFRHEKSGFVIGASMKRVYSYRGFQVTIQVEQMLDLAKGTPLQRTRGFIAIVHICPDANPDSGVSLRLAIDSRRPYPSEAEALMRGYSAAQRWIDDTIVRERNEEKHLGQSGTT
jgi:hypothetical protein